MKRKFESIFSWQSISLFFIAAALTFTSSCTGSTDTDNRGTIYHAYFLGGQSNMTGFGYSEELPAKFSSPLESVRIYQGNAAPDGSDDGGLGIWARLEPGFGAGFRSDGRKNRLGDRFGPELSFGRRLSYLFPERNIAIIKYAPSGSSLSTFAANFGTWDPDFQHGRGLNQYDFALRTIGAALTTADIDGDGKIDKLKPSGIIWMQGEADANDEMSAKLYENNLRRLMELLRAAMHVDDLPVVIGRVTDSGMDEDGQVMNYIETVQHAQATYVTSDTCAAYVTEIDNYQHSEDGWHYVSEAYLKMGTAFANAVRELEQSCLQ